jgi:putative intracellular protease/amidase
MRILFVLTSHHLLGTTGKRTGFWLDEFAAPYYVLKDAGAAIAIASPKGGQPPIDPVSELPENQTASTRRLRGDREALGLLAQTAILGEVAPTDFDALFYPGGHGPLWDLPDNTASIALIEACLRAGKPVAAVCHGPAALLNVRVPDGGYLLNHRQVTGFSNVEEAAVGLTRVVPFLLEDRLAAQGALYRKAAQWVPFVVSDGLLVTGQNPASSALAAGELLALLAAREVPTHAGVA